MTVICGMSWLPDTCLILLIVLFVLLMQLMLLGSAEGKFELYLISTYLFEVLVAGYIVGIKINFYLSLMFICTLTALKKLSKKKETEIEKGMVQMLKYPSDRRKKAGK